MATKVSAVDAIILIKMCESLESSRVPYFVDGRNKIGPTKQALIGQLIQDCRQSEEIESVSDNQLINMFERILVEIPEAITKMTDETRLQYVF